MSHLFLHGGWLVSQRTSEPFIPDKHSVEILCFGRNVRHDLESATPGSRLVAFFSLHEATLQFIQSWLETRGVFHFHANYLQDLESAALASGF